MHPQLNDLQQRSDQIQSLKAPQLAFATLNNRQSELENKYNDLINLIANEIDAEKARQDEIQFISRQIQEINSNVPEFDLNALENYRDNVIPQLWLRLDELNKPKHQYISSSTVDLKPQFDHLSSNINTHLNSLQQHQKQSAIDEEWLQKKKAIIDKIKAVELEADPILQRYADADSKEPSEIAQLDIQKLANLSERLLQLNAELSTTSGWLNNVEEMSDANRQNAADDLEAIDRELKSNGDIYSTLNNQLSNDLLNNEDINQRYQQIQIDLSTLEQQFRTQDPTQQSNSDEFILKLNQLLDIIHQLRQDAEKQSKVQLTNEVDLNALENRAVSLRSDIQQQQSLKQMEASELEKEVENLKREIEEKINEASQLTNDQYASIDQLQQAANILDTVQSKLLTLKQLNNSQQEIQTNENAALRQKLATITPELQQKWLAKRRQISARMEDLLRELGQRLAILVSEGQQLLVNNGAHPDQFNSHADRLRVLIKETEAILSSATETSLGVDYAAADSLLASIDSAIASSTIKTTKPSASTATKDMDNQLKLTQSMMQNAEKVRDLLDSKWIIWAEFCKLREATYNKLEFLKKPLFDMQEKGLRELDEAREDIQTLTVSSS